MAQFKNKRNQYAQQSRKKNRQSLIETQRILITTKNIGLHFQPLIIEHRFADHLRHLYSTMLLQSNINSLAQNINDHDPAKILQGIVGIRYYLFNNDAETMIENKIVPNLLFHAVQVEFPQIQLQSLYCIGIIVERTYEQCMQVIKNDGISKLIKLIVSKNVEIAAQASEIIGNIGYGKPKLREQIIENQGIENLVQSIEYMFGESSSLSQKMCGLVGVLSKIVRTEPWLGFQRVGLVLKIFFDLLRKNFIHNQEIIANILWVISHYIYKSKKSKDFDRIQYFIDSDIYLTFPLHLKSKNPKIMVPILRLMAAIASGTQNQADYLNQLEIINLMYEFLLPYPHRAIRKHSCIIIYNLLSTSHCIHQQVLSHQPLIVLLLKMLEQDAPEVKSEICIIFTKFKTFSTLKACLIFEKINIMKYLCEIIRSETDSKLLGNGLECLDIVLKVGQSMRKSKDEINQFKQKMFEQSAMESFENLQMHPNQVVFQKASAIIQKYFDIECTL